MSLKLCLKHGEKQQMWINKLQIAIIEKNTDELDRLLDTMPTFDSVKKMESAMYLLKEASELLHTLKDETASTMGQLKKNIDFLRSTETKKPNKLDIKS